MFLLFFHFNLFLLNLSIFAMHLNLSYSFFYRKCVFVVVLLFQVQVEVEEREIDADGKIISRAIQQHTSDYAEMPTPPGRHETTKETSTPAIRDSSRNRLQRLGALYSGSETISSPVHKNEARFDEAELNALPTGNANRTRNPARSGKLAALASSINSWEDESAMHVEPKSEAIRKDTTANTKRMAPAAPKVIATSPRKQQPSQTMEASSKQVTKSIVRPTNSTNNSEKAPSKQLKWDKNVMDSLEAQGFTRRESTTSKMVYDYAPSDKPIIDMPKKNNDIAPPVVVPVSNNNTAKEPPNKLPLAASIGKGLVSGRAALFETGGNPSKSSFRLTTKDPAEMSLKDRLALFEKNKGTALMPKAAFGMSASQAQISSNVSSSGASTSVWAGAAFRQNAGQKQRDEYQLQPNKVAAQSRPVSIVQTPPVTEKPKIDVYNKPGKWND